MEGIKVGTKVLVELTVIEKVEARLGIYYRVAKIDKDGLYGTAVSVLPDDIKQEVKDEPVSE